MQNLLNSYFYYNSFTQNFLNGFFSELLFLAGDRKVNKIYQRKLKPGDRLWGLETDYWKLCFYGQLMYIRQTSQLSVLPCVTS